MRQHTHPPDLEIRGCKYAGFDCTPGCEGFSFLVWHSACCALIRPLGNGQGSSNQATDSIRSAVGIPSSGLAGRSAWIMYALVQKRYLCNRHPSSELEFSPQTPNLHAISCDGGHLRELFLKIGLRVRVRSLSVSMQLFRSFKGDGYHGRMMQPW